MGRLRWKGRNKKKTTRAAIATCATKNLLLPILIVVAVLLLGNSGAVYVFARDHLSSSESTLSSSRASCSATSSESSASESSGASAAAAAAAFQVPLNQKMRAWHCHGRNQRELVERLTQAGIIRNPQVGDAMRLVDRCRYVVGGGNGDRGGGGDRGSSAYVDAPQSIGLGQTISAPHMHAHVLEEILPHVLPRRRDPPPSDAAGGGGDDDDASADGEVKILDVGCGSGYLTACFGRWLKNRPDDNTATSKSILGRRGRVFGIDIHRDLVDFASDNIARDDGDLLDSGVVSLKLANGWDGLPDEAPFDAIHVGAAAASFPSKLASQLKVGGVLVVPVGPVGGIQNLYKVERVAGGGGEEEEGGGRGGGRTGGSEKFREKDYRVTELLGVRYVPLIQGPN